MRSRPRDQIVVPVKTKFKEAAVHLREKLAKEKAETPAKVEQEQQKPKHWRKLTQNPQKPKHRRRHPPAQSTNVNVTERLHHLLNQNIQIHLHLQPVPDEADLTADPHFQEENPRHRMMTIFPSSMNVKIRTSTISF